MAEIPEYVDSHEIIDAKTAIAGDYRRLSQAITGLSNKAAAIREQIESLEISYKSSGGAITKKTLLRQIEQIEDTISKIEQSLGNMGGAPQIHTSKIDGVPKIKYY